MKNIPYGRQHISDDDVKAVIQSLKGDLITQGPKISEFEKKFSEYIGCKFSVAISNGTAALHLSALALDVDKTSNVICSPITFAASANCVLYCGGKLTFADIDPETITLDINSVRKLLEDAPKGTYTGIVPVDFAGYPVNLEAFKKLADEYNLWILEDACHAPGGYFTDSKGVQQNCGNGQYANLSIFSFHPVKHIACGEGGMITTNSKDLYEKLLILRTHGITKRPELLKENHGGWYYDMVDLGYNYRLTDFQAALGISQLKRAKKGLQKRKAIAKRYDEAFKGSKIVFKQAPSDSSHAYHLYVIQIENRKELYDHLRKHNIFAQVHYIPVHTLSYYQNLGFKKGSCPHAEAYYERCLSLPMYPTLTENEQDFVIEQVKKISS